MIKRLLTSAFLLAMLLCSMIVPVAAAENNNQLISDNNPLSGKKIQINFLDSEENIVVTENLVYGQTIYVVTRQGEKLKEYAVRQPVNIPLPEPAIEKGYVFDYWDSFYKEGDLVLKPVSRIEVNISTADETPMVKLTCDIGHMVNVYSRVGELLESHELKEPGSINITAQPVLPNYVFTGWGTDNQLGEYRIQAVYDTVMYFVDGNNSSLFQVTLPVGSKIMVTDAQNTTQDVITVADSQTISLNNPAQQEGLQFYNWGTVYQDGVLYIKPTYGEPLVPKKEGQDPPAPPNPVHADIVVWEASGSAEMIVFDESNGTITTNGVTLPSAAITWGIPVILAGIVGLIVLLVKKSKTKKRNDIEEEEEEKEGTLVSTTHRL